MLLNFLPLFFDTLKFLASGSLGNAYRVNDDKVLKITTDKKEAYSISKIMNSNNKSIVKYYSINMYKLKNNYVYLILMDYVLPLTEFIKNKKYNIERNLNFIDSILDLVYTNWTKMNTKDDFMKIIKESNLGFYICPKCEGSGLDEESKKCKKCEDGQIFLSGKKLNTFDKNMIDKVWELYQNLKDIIRWPDLHVYNIGIKNNRLKFFDYTNNMPISKFDTPTIIK